MHTPADIHPEEGGGYMEPLGVRTVADDDLRDPAAAGVLRKGMEGGGKAKAGRPV